MNAARLDKSKRLQRTLAALRAAGSKGLSTLELYNWTGSMAVHSDISEIRANGLEIECERHGRTPEGRLIFVYRLVGERAA